MELMTIGYESLKLTEFFEILQRCKVSMLVDVRELPISRKAGFAKKALASGLAAHGIQYVHMAELGCPRDIRHTYREDGDWERYTIAFKKSLETRISNLEQLAQLMKVERCCLLCFEEDYNFCHRSYVADKVAPLVGVPVRVFHLTGPVEGRVVRYDPVAV